MADEMTEMRAEYWQHIRSTVDEIESDVRNGNLDPDDIAERLDSDCDSQWTIYTYRAKCLVCFISDNPDALVDELGSDELVRDGNLNWSGMAYFAMRADITDRLGDLEEIATEGRDEREAAEENEEAATE